jgi:hypothetical protein
MNSEVQFYESVNYFVRGDEEARSVGLRVGDYLEFDDDENANSFNMPHHYARLEGILKHVDDAGRSRIWLALRWLEAMESDDLQLSCPRYRLGPLNIAGQSARVFHPLAVVDKTPFCHFIVENWWNIPHSVPPREGDILLRNKFLFKAM